MTHCKTLGCKHTAPTFYDFCAKCLRHQNEFARYSGETPVDHSTLHILPSFEKEDTLADKYPQYYKPVGALTEVDVYAVHQLFELYDTSGCLHHASKKLLLSGVRTGGKSAYDDIREARDTLSRWLQLNQERQVPPVSQT